jgi:glycosyltransferase involved in cell wall biosynthesis
MQIPLLTVAVPTCNGAAHLAETLHSILDQECPPFDLLVCDDQSDDGCVEIVRTMAGERARIVVNQDRLGLAGNWNQCMALSRTPWVSIFHQDDVMLPRHLASVTRALELADRETTSIGLVAGPARVIDEHSKPVPDSVVDPGGKVVTGMMPRNLEFLGFPPGDFTEFLKEDNPLRCSAVVTNRAAHADVGGFDPSYRYVVDWEFWYRVSRKYAVSWKLHEPTVLVRWHASSETHRFKTGTEDLEEAAFFLDSIFEQEDHGNPAAARRRGLANRRLARAFLNRSHEALRHGQANLAQTCLHRAWALSSRKVFWTLATDQRLCLQMSTLALSPRLARHWFARDHERSTNVSS